MKIHAITIDTANPQKLAAWWSDALGIPVAQDYGRIVQLAPSPAIPPLQFQKTVGLPTQHNSVHLDLKTPDLDSDTERLVALGAIVVEQFELPQIRYTTLTDPDGNKFDLVAE
ncbi:VOC family protein [Caballeronia sp. RCC_10]|uniref:VOC family protein n=1 Tax=Caballeronia sp. RCC_10 TaxID=3239227 RepID=UPI003523C97E